MKPTHLRVLLIGVLLCVQLATVIAIVVGMQRDATEELTRAAARRLELLVERIGERTHEHFASAEEVLSDTDRLIADGIVDSGDDAELERHFVARLQRHRWLAGIMLGRADGSFLYVNRDADNGFRTKRIDAADGRREVDLTYRNASLEMRLTRRDPLDRYDPRERPWYVLARADRGIAWTDPYVFFSSGLPGISAALATERPSAAGTPEVSDTSNAPIAPIAPSWPAVRRIDAGVLALDIDIHALSAFVATLPGTEGGSAAIVDGSGHAVAYSDVERLAAVRGERELPMFAGLGDASLGALLARVEERGGSTLDVLADAESIEVDGEQHLALALPFPARTAASSIVEPSAGPRRVSGPGPWLLLAQTPVADYSAGLFEVFTAKLRALVAVLMFSALVAVIAVIRLTRPIYRIHHDATIDGLTGACNRAEFERRVHKRLSRRRRDDARERIVLVVLDLDGFKRINDDFGHAAGDAVLVSVVARLQKRLRSSDVVGRLGGDEFVLALHVDFGDDFVTTVERLRAAVVARPIRSGEGEHRIGITAGIAMHERGETVSETLRRADRALVEGKAREKNRCYLAPPVSGRPALRLHTASG